MTDADKIKLVATVLIRRLCVTTWVSVDGQQQPPCFTGDPTSPVNKEDERVFARLKRNDRDLHDQIWTDAATICAALERAEHDQTKQNHG